MFKKLIAVFFLLSLSATPSFSTCYSKQYVPPHVDCGGDKGNSADFEVGCTFKNFEWKQIEVACPPIHNPITSNRAGGGGREQGGHYVDTNNDGRTDSYRPGPGFGSDSPGARTSNNSYTDHGRAGYGSSSSSSGTSHSWW